MALAQQDWSEADMKETAEMQILFLQDMISDTLGASQQVEPLCSCQRSSIQIKCLERTTYQITLFSVYVNSCTM